MPSGSSRQCSRLRSQEPSVVRDGGSTAVPRVHRALEEGSEQVYDAMVAGTYRFGREDLAFMDVGGGTKTMYRFIRC